MKDEDKIELFERAFSSGTGGCRRTCNCGMIYFNATERGCWEPGELKELEKLESQKKAVSTDYKIGDISFEGDEYAR